MPLLHDYESYDAVGLAELVRRKEVSPLELVDAAIERIEARNPQLNAVVYPMFAQARQAAQGELPDGPLRGVPFLVKDLLAMVAGVPISFGTRLLKNWAPPADSELVRRWKAAGLVIAGKTNTSEFGFMPWTEPELFGPTHNPYDLTRTAGGSSGGSGAAVAARLVPVASGGDGGGSIRVPASVNGVFGLKPTRGRTPAGPLYYELWEGCAIEHALTRSVRDSAALLDATAGADIGAPYAAPPQERPFQAEVGREPGRLRIAFTTQALIGVDDPPPDPECVRGLRATVKLLESLGHEVVEAAPKIDYAELAMAFMTMTSGQAANDIRETAALVGKKPARGDFELSTWVLGQLGRAFTAADYVRGDALPGHRRAPGRRLLQPVRRAPHTDAADPTLRDRRVAAQRRRATPARRGLSLARRQSADRLRPGAPLCAEDLQLHPLPRALQCDRAAGHVRTAALDGRRSSRGHAVRRPLWG